MNLNHEKQSLGNLGYHKDVKTDQVQDQIHNTKQPKFQDLRQEYSGCINPVVSQGSCGSCWSFAVTGAIADAYSIQNAKANGKGSCDTYTELSNEEMLWCSGGQMGGSHAADLEEICDGGSMRVAIEQAYDHGITTAICNPYGHFDSKDFQDYKDCPTECKGTGDINNRVTRVGFGNDCQNTENGALDSQGNDCYFYNANSHWCGTADTDDFIANDMCCGCQEEEAKYVTLQTTAEIQAQLVQNGPLTVGIPVYDHFQDGGFGIYKPVATQVDSCRGHAVECVGWGHEENGEGFWIMKNSWGCSWADAGYFKQGWAYNSKSYFQGLPAVNGASTTFVNDVLQDQEPECKVPQDSNNSDHCATYGENDICSLCNSGQELMSDASCQLKHEGFASEEMQAIDDGFPPSEDIQWQQCKNSSGINGYLCPADSLVGKDSQCLTLDTDEVECSTWLDMVKTMQWTNCFLCRSGLIDFCVNQSMDQCLECMPGYSPNERMDECLSDSCEAIGQEATASGDCVVPVADCAPNSTTPMASGALYCTLCNPGFKLELGSCEALPDPENCGEVEMANPERICTVCSEGQYLGTFGKCNLITEDDRIEMVTLTLNYPYSLDRIDYYGATSTTTGGALDTDQWKLATYTEAVQGSVHPYLLRLSMLGYSYDDGNPNAKFAVTVDTLGNDFTNLGTWISEFDTFTYTGVIAAQVSPLVGTGDYNQEPDLTALTSEMVDPSLMYNLRFWVLAGGGGGHSIHLTDIKVTLKDSVPPKDDKDDNDNEEECKDTDQGARDNYGDGCPEQSLNLHWCGDQDTDSFNSNEMCCACKNKSKVKASLKSNKAKEVKSTRQTKSNLQNKLSTKSQRKRKNIAINKKKMSNKKLRFNHKKLSKR